jgi:hypothetical protein
VCENNNRAYRFERDVWACGRRKRWERIQWQIAERGWESSSTDESASSMRPVDDQTLSHSTCSNTHFTDLDHTRIRRFHHKQLNPKKKKKKKSIKGKKQKLGFQIFLFRSLSFRERNGWRGSFCHVRLCVSREAVTFLYFCFYFLF